MCTFKIKSFTEIALGSNFLILIPRPHAYWNITNFYDSSPETTLCKGWLIWRTISERTPTSWVIIMHSRCKWIIYQICFHYFSVKTLKIYFPSTQFQQSFVHRAGLYLDKYLWICFHMKNEWAITNTNTVPYFESIKWIISK